MKHKRSGDDDDDGDFLVSPHSSYDEMVFLLSFLTRRSAARRLRVIMPGCRYVSAGIVGF